MNSCNIDHKLRHCHSDTIREFLCELGMKPNIHLLEIIIFTLYHVIVRHTKTSSKIATSDFHNHFSVLKINGNFWIFFYEKYWTMRQTFINEMFQISRFLKCFIV